uniref:Smr domain-containing protein n=1 Tax=Arundo donax TaxID=35708 RepID=A0A0A9F369_ARUDO
MYKKIPNSGWAAFDRRWRGTDGRDDETDVSSFPALPDSRASNSYSSSVTENNRLKPKPFASVVRPSDGFAAVINGGGNKHPGNFVDSVNYGAISVSDNKIKRLKDAHSWADINLIEDVLAAVNDDVGQAYDILKAMVSPDLSTGEGKKSGQLAAEMNKENATADNGHPDSSHLLPLPMNLSSIPMEPELEELDDDYLNHRKDALKMMRAATKHSQAASNAFLRGDHAAAKGLSLRAQEERAAAEKLNNKAAEEIFRHRNSNNDIWKIDMHGLHASEAVAVLERHLHMIEFQPPGTSAASTDELAEFEAAYSESTTGSNVEFATEKVVLRRPNQAILHVITGIGRHSKGQASLPVAVRGFLIENRYRFDELRPGVFAVRPKYRRR